MFGRVLGIWMVAALALGPAPVFAQSDSPSAEAPLEVAPLLEALGLFELAPVLRAEGLSYAETLQADMFPGRDTDRWMALLDKIYDVERMRQVMEAEMAQRLDPSAEPALRAFFEADVGQRIVDLEVTARRAMLDDEIDAASRATLARLREEGDPRLVLLDQFVEVNDLIEMNVAGALNSNLAFYRGMMDGGAFDGVMTEREMLADVWSQAESIRDETAEWLYAYLALAYQPLPDADLEAYLALSERPEGTALNTALFAAFDQLFTAISRDLGRAVALMMAGEDI